jgi:hypothetical protein
MASTTMSVFLLRSSRSQRVAMGLLWLVIVLETLVVFLATDRMAGDSEVYLSLAEGLKTGSFGFFQAGNFYHEAIRGPGYPLFLWFLLHILHLPLSGIDAIQFLLYLASIALLYRWIKKHYTVMHGLVFLGLMTLYPFPAVYAARIMTEGVTTFLIISIGVVAAQAGPLRSRSAIGLGLLAGSIILIRPTMILLPIILVVARALMHRRDQQQARDGANALLMLGIAALVVLPFTLRNQRVFNRFTPLPVAGAAGISLYTASWQAELSYADIMSLWARQPSAHAQKIGYVTAVEEINSQIDAPATALAFSLESYGPDPALEIRASGVIGRAAIARITSHPGMYVQHVGRNIWALWNTKEYPRSIPAIGTAGLSIISGLFTLLAGIGIALQLIRQTGRPAIILAVILLYFLCIHLWMHTEARYTAPVRLLLVFHALVALMWAIGRWRRSDKRLVPAIGAASREQ